MNLLIIRKRDGDKITLYSDSQHLVSHPSINNAGDVVAVIRHTPSSGYEVRRYVPPYSPANYETVLVAGSAQPTVHGIVSAMVNKSGSVAVLGYYYEVTPDQVIKHDVIDIFDQDSKYIGRAYDTADEPHVNSDLENLIGFNDQNDLLFVGRAPSSLLKNSTTATA